MMRHASLSLVFLVTVLSSCDTPRTIPDAQALDRAYATLKAEHAGDYAQLDAERAAGTLSPEAYAQQRSNLDAYVQSKATERLWNRHEMDQIHRKSLGLPTPDSPVAITVPQAGAMGNSGSTYVPFNQRDQGNQGMSGNAMQQMMGALPARTRTQ